MLKQFLIMWVLMLRIMKALVQVQTRRRWSWNAEYVKKRIKSKSWRLLVPVMVLSSLLIGSVSKDGAIRKEVQSVKSVFSPNYSLPHATTNDITAIGIRQGWGHNTDLEDSVASAERQLLQTEYEDYAVAQTSSIACLGSVVLIVRKQM